MEYDIKNLFPTPVYTTHRESGLDLTEKKEIEDIVEGGLQRQKFQSISIDTYIFDTKLKKLKEFCEQHIKIYVEEVINPKEELDFYITQSWLNVIKPGAYHPPHQHPNSIISGVFYVSTIENDKILFNDPNNQLKEARFKIEIKDFNYYNSLICMVAIEDFQLILFPSWLAHGVELNNSTKDRISLSFNIFVKGTFGDEEELTQLVL